MDSKMIKRIAVALAAAGVGAFAAINGGTTAHADTISPSITMLQQ